jgi:hypothetical protein
MTGAAGLLERSAGPDTVAAMAARAKTKTLYTIGYEGADVDRFLATLADAGVATVADVRAVALSRKKGFSKNQLRAHPRKVE